MPQIGDYDVPVLVLRRQLPVNPDNFGELVESWPEAGAARHWAEIEELSGTEQLAGQVRQSGTSLRVTIRKPVTVEAVDRLKREDTGEELSIGGIFRDSTDVILTCAV